MRLFFFMMFLLSTEKIFAQTNRIYIKVAADSTVAHSVGQIYLSGGRDVLVQTVSMPMNSFFSFVCGSEQKITIAIDCHSLPVIKAIPATFSCGDSVIIYIPKGTWKVLNKND